MKVIAARLGLCRHHARYGLAEFCVVILQCDFGFRDRVQIGFTTIIPRIGSWLSVPSNSKAVPLKCCPLHKNLLAALRILRGGVAPSQLLRARREQFEVVKLRFKMGRSSTYFALNSIGHVGAVSLKLRGLGRHFDLFAGGADLELAVHVVPVSA